MPLTCQNGCVSDKAMMVLSSHADWYLCWDLIVLAVVVLAQRLDIMKPDWY